MNTSGLYKSSPFFIASHKYHQRFSVNVWPCIVGNRMVGRYPLPDRSTGEQYLAFQELRLPGLLQPVSSTTQTHIHVTHAGWSPSSLFHRCVTLPEWHIFQTMNGTWQTCGSTFTLPRFKPT
ncbi:hypothetical protein NPIL_376781 [Nephila pilipes]|uniref:Uncharacterized protein n=1 Tax=Nephila pilipes TaxID=299642 RepID=A0A8X6QAS5_NEPPI|nr:hypothetical protein NPIL_376781 [Nephila pilipes]